MPGCWRGGDRFDYLIQKEENFLTAQITQQKGFRGGFYFLGLLVLALGITMNTKAGLGVSPIISISYCASVIWSRNFGNMTLVLYSVLLLVEMVFHCLSYRREQRQGVEGSRKLSMVLLLDALQFPLSLVFTRFLNGFSARIPNLATDCTGAFWGTLTGRVIFLLAAIVLTGVGAALSLSMRVIPNPGDGIVQAIADFSGKSMGFTKNCLDISCVSLAVLIGWVASGHVVGIGLGTILSMLGVGRVVAVFQHFCFRKTAVLAGLPLS